MPKNLMKTTLALVVLGSSIGPAFAESDAASQKWKADHAKYEFMDPMKATCADMTGTKSVYQEHVVAYLSGRDAAAEAANEHGNYKPLSVPKMIKVCEGSPKKYVHEAIRDERNR